MNCPQCGFDNPETNDFCGRCGVNLAEARRQRDVVNQDEVRYCYRHKKEATLLACGRCDRPICTKCAVFGPAGIRCPECGRMNIAFRPMGAVHDFLLGAKRIFASGPYTIYICVLVIMMVLGSIRGCSYLNRPDNDQEPRYEREIPDDTGNAKTPPTSAKP